MLKFGTLMTSSGEANRKVKKKKKSHSAKTEQRLTGKATK